MKLIHYALAFMLLLTACSKDDEKNQSFTSQEFTWTGDVLSGIIINSTDAYVRGGSSSYIYTRYYTWLDYGEIGSLQDINIYYNPAMSYDDSSHIPIREKHGYIMKSWILKGMPSTTYNYTAYYITKIHRDKDGNILYIKGKRRDFVPYKGWI